MVGRRAASGSFHEIKWEPLRPKIGVQPCTFTFYTAQSIHSILTQMSGEVRGEVHKALEIMSAKAYDSGCRDRAGALKFVEEKYPELKDIGGTFDMYLGAVFEQHMLKQTCKKIVAEENKAVAAAALKEIHEESSMQ